jgi:glyoxylase-like metal-dependent hydrolase (beta-lactamase superfamily II)
MPQSTSATPLPAAIAKALTCGTASAGSLNDLRQALGQAGLRLEHVRLLVCTHAHIDHYGQAADVLREAGCELWMHPAHAHTTEAAAEPERTLQWRLEVARHSGVPLAELEEYESVRRDRSPGLAEVVLPDRELVGGVEVETDLGVWRTHETPGHAPSHVVLHQPERRLLLSGDHLLGRVSLYYDQGYTPDPAGEFLSSLDVVEGLDVDLVLAGHGRPVRDAPGLVAANRRTIAARPDGIRSALAGGPRPAYDLVDTVLGAAELPIEIPTFARVSWILPETICYLTHLELRGEVERADDGDTEQWRLLGAG